MKNLKYDGFVCNHTVHGSVITNPPDLYSYNIISRQGFHYAWEINTKIPNDMKIQELERCTNALKFFKTELYKTGIIFK